VSLSRKFPRSGALGDGHAANGTIHHNRSLSGADVQSSLIGARPSASFQNVLRKPAANVTSHHYPQLVGPAALDAIAQVPALALAKLIGLQSAPPNLADTTYSQVGGNKVPPDTLVEIRTDLVDIAKRYGFPNSRSQEGLRKFDSESAKQLHML